MALQNKAIKISTLVGRAITAVVSLITLFLTVRFLLNQNPTTLAHVLMALPFFGLCLAGSWAYNRFTS